MAGYGASRQRKHYRTFLGGGPQVRKSRLKFLRSASLGRQLHTDPAGQPATPSPRHRLSDPPRRGISVPPSVKPAAWLAADPSRPWSRRPRRQPRRPRARSRGVMTPRRMNQSEPQVDSPHLTATGPFGPAPATPQSGDGAGSLPFGGGESRCSLSRSWSARHCLTIPCRTCSFSAAFAEPRINSFA